MSATIIGQANETSPTLNGLPAEVLRQIGFQLDTPAGLALALVSKTLSHHANPIIWRHIQIYPDTDSEDNEESLDLEEEAKRSDEKLLDMWAMWEGYRLKGNWEYVESISTSISPDALESLIQMLGFVSPNLQSLRIDHDDDMNDEGSDRNQRFDMLFLQHHLRIGTFDETPNLSFPSFTRVTLGEDAMTVFEFIPLLILIAPNLIYLDVSFDDGCRMGDGKLDFYRRLLPSTFDQPTILRSLAIQFSPKYGAPIGLPQEVVFKTLSGLLINSPLLERLSIDGMFDDQLAVVTASWVLAINQLVLLKDIHWAPLSAVRHYDDDSRLAEGDVCSSLASRMVLPYDNWTLPEPFPEVEVALPNLTSLFLNTMRRTFMCYSIEGYIYDFQQLQLPLPDDTATFLLRCPKLSTIRFRELSMDCNRLQGLFDLNKIEKETFPSVLIRSLCHGDEEVLHLRILCIKISHKATKSAREDGMKSGSFEEMWVVGEPGPNSGDFMLDLPDNYKSGKVLEPVWLDSSYYKGSGVPMEILTEMRKAEGVMPDDDWNVRGRQIGDKSWKVLQDWYEKLHPKAASV